MDRTMNCTPSRTARALGEGQETNALTLFLKPSKSVFDDDVAGVRSLP